MRQREGATVKAEVSAAVGALRLGMTRDRVVRRIQTHELKGRFDPACGWLVEVAALEAYEHRSTSMSPAA